jgi:O-acetyl-ADP-ribose deacetylase (regulator of RNase III)
MNYTEIKGDLIQLAQSGHFDVIAHGCNCFCVMGRGVAPQMAKAFGCDSYKMEDTKTAGDINKLGQIDWEVLNIAVGNSEFDIMDHDLTVVNVYSQYTPNVALKPLDYEALTLGLRKINHTFEGKHIGLPQIGAGLAGGDWTRIKEIIQRELKDMKVTVVIYNG